MRKRLKSFLPIVLVALIVQIFAPVGACWVASIAVSDPLAQAVICHGNTAPGSTQSDQPGPHRARDGCCSVCSVLYSGAPVDIPQIAFVVTFERHVAPVVWHALSPNFAASHGSSPPQARAPPSIS
jgi:hypothetical protein